MENSVISFSVMMSSLRHHKIARMALLSRVGKLWVGIIIFLIIAINIIWNHKTQAAEVNAELLNESTRPHTIYMEKLSTGSSRLGIKNIFELAREYATKNLPNETYQLYPIPIRHSGSINLVFLWGISRAVPGEGRHYIPPHWMVKFDSNTGDLIMEKQVFPADFNQPVTPGQFIGTHYWKKDGYIKNRIELENRIYELLDRLLPYFSEENNFESSATIQSAALELKSIYNIISKQFMRPYYCAVGHEFSMWIDDHANVELPPFCPSS
ncbi:MAG: hypothetical protein ABW161_10640 [Candidatus Thiodiazotropha sp.]